MIVSRRKYRELEEKYSSVIARNAYHVGKLRVRDLAIGMHESEIAALKRRLAILLNSLEEAGIKVIDGQVVARPNISREALKSLLEEEMENLKASLKHDTVIGISGAALTCKDEVLAVYPDAHINQDYSGSPSADVAVFRKAEESIGDFCRTEEKAWISAAIRLRSTKTRAMQERGE